MRSGTGDPDQATRRAVKTTLILVHFLSSSGLYCGVLTTKNGIVQSSFGLALPRLRAQASRGHRGAFPQINPVVT